MSLDSSGHDSLLFSDLDGLEQAIVNLESILSPQNWHKYRDIKFQ